jgi:hypothetical protein
MDTSDSNASSGEELVNSGDDQMDTRETGMTEPPPEPALRQDPAPHTSPGRADEDEEAVQAAALAESPAKRSKTQPSVKVMPRNYMEGDVRDLGYIIAHMLMELNRINDPLPFDPDRLTRFHSRYDFEAACSVRCELVRKSELTH